MNEFIYFSNHSASIDLLPSPCCPQLGNQTSFWALSCSLALSTPLSLLIPPALLSYWSHLSQKKALFLIAQSSCTSIQLVSLSRIWWRHLLATTLGSTGTSSCRSKRLWHELWISWGWSPNTYWLSPRWRRLKGSQKLYFRSSLDASWRNNSMWCLKLRGWIFDLDAADTQISCPRIKW